MTDEHKQEPLTEDDLAQANGEPLPDREQMTVIRGADPLPAPINPELTAADYSIDPVPTDVE